MGKSWKNPIKAANAAKKGAIFTKAAREIQVAARSGADPSFNSRLRLAIDAAKRVSCPNDTIERAIKKGSGQLEGQIIEEITYEGYGPHGVGILVETQTDNKNRTAPEIRTMFKSHGGNLSEAGSVAWMFERVCEVEATHSGKFDPEEEAIEAGANEVHAEEGTSFVFLAAADQSDVVRGNLEKRGWKISRAELSFQAKNKTELSPEQRKEVEALLAELDEHDDTHRVHATL